MTKKHLFSRLLKKAVSMALWMKASLCGKSSLLEQILPRTPSRPIRSLPTYQVGPCNPRNPWLINDLRVCKELYKCRETFTGVMSALQIKLFMQNKANFRKSQMNINKVLTKDYENKTLGERGKKQSQTNPNEPKSKKAKMNVTSIFSVAYENKSPIRAPKKQSQIPKRQTPIQASLSKRIMKITELSGSGKTNPNKPNCTLTYLRRLIFMAHSGIIPELKTVLVYLTVVSNRRRQIDDILGVKSMKRCSLLIVRDYSDGSFRRD